MAPCTPTHPPLTFQVMFVGVPGSQPRAVPSPAWGVQAVAVRWLSGTAVAQPTCASAHRSPRGYSDPVPTVPLWPLYPQWSSVPGGTVSLPGPGLQGSKGSGSAQPCPTVFCQVRESGRGQDCSAVASSPPLLGLRRVRQKINKNR